MNTFLYTLFVSIKRGTPLLLGTTGEILTEKSGSLNLGVEGMMAIGAIVGYYFGCLANSLFVALLMAFVGGAFAGAIFAFLTITMQANQNVTGLTMTIFGTALCKFIGSYLYSNGKLPKIPSNIANALQENSSNLFAQNAIVYVAIAIAIACWIYLRFSKKGLHLRAIGENPSSADAVGINVNAYKYLNVIVGGGITGIGGVYMALVINGGAWNENWINGYGWISLALVIFANWNPLVAIFGSYLFGLLGALQSLSGNFAHEFPKALGWMSAIPPDFYQMLPFLITAVILIVSSIKKGRSQSPSALGRNYYREER